jgi:hypothetical protein
MSEPTNEPIKLAVGRPDENGVYREETVSITGEQLDYYEEGQSRFWLYRWLDRGYLVHVEDDKREEKTVYPYSGGFTAEEVAKRWLRFANTVGILPDTDRDFDERSP